MAGLLVCISGGETRGSVKGATQSKAAVPSAEAQMVMRGIVMDDAFMAHLLLAWMSIRGIAAKVCFIEQVCGVTRASPRSQMRDLGHPGSISGAEVSVVAGDPVFAGRGEDVEVDGVFEGEDFMGDVRRDDEDFVGIEDGFSGGV